MSTTDSHNQTKSCKTSARTSEEFTFDGRLIKKEQIDTCIENGDAGGGAAATTTTTGITSNNATTATITTTFTTTTATTTTTVVVVDKRQLPPVPAGRFTSNGFHRDGDLQQDVIVAKFAALASHNSSSPKQDKIRIMIEDAIR